MGHSLGFIRGNGPHILGLAQVTRRSAFDSSRESSGKVQPMTTTAARKAGRAGKAGKAGKTARRARRSRALRWPARAGLVVRGLFYLLLASLAIHVAVNATSAKQADPNGALRVVADQPLGLVVLGAAALGFAAFAIARLVAAVVALTGEERQWWDGVRACVFGDHSQGSEQSHRTFTAKLLGHAGGRVALVVIGIAVICFYGYQAYVAISGGFEDSLDDKRMPSWLQRATRVLGTGGIGARVIAWPPVGVFLIVAAVTHDAHKALGLDASLRDMSRHWWGVAVLSIVAVGLIAFALYSFLEAAYRKVADA
jgi:hypothetical protein